MVTAARNSATRASRLAAMAELFDDAIQHPRMNQGQRDDLVADYEDADLQPVRERFPREGCSPERYSVPYLNLVAYVRWNVEQRELRDRLIAIVFPDVFGETGIMPTLHNCRELTTLSLLVFSIEAVQATTIKHPCSLLRITFARFFGARALRVAPARSASSMHQARRLGVLTQLALKAYRGSPRGDPPRVATTPHDNTQLSTCDNSINMSPIEAALAAIASLEPGESFSYKQVAQQYGCNRTTLARRHQGVSSLCSTKAADQQALYPQQEQELLQYINRLTERGLPPTRAMIRRFGSDIAKRELRKNWVDRYIKRHKVNLISRWATRIDRARHHADSISKYTLYFSLLHEKISKYNVEACNMYNMDKKGCMLGILTCSKRIFSKRLYEEGNIKAHIQDGNWEWITLLACICADGSALAPALIYQSTSGLIQDTWLQAMRPEDQVYISSSPSRWTNNKIGLS
ncbi:hypothetical protein CC86DRAFT_425334 [Ophiobolus disseminans]|uniref:HTH CENPB-type domain-containing protein n=1 Tax=Ophiobolus disseminans TaxID=1469910 RepID=A0A6A7AJ50_9PLEO|nr:hypothetical protein CC86DRAFT_425334 [Ophiobolus disseminans]